MLFRSLPPLASKRFGRVPFSLLEKYYKPRKDRHRLDDSVEPQAIVDYFVYGVSLPKFPREAVAELVSRSGNTLPPLASNELLCLAYAKWMD